MGVVISSPTSNLLVRGVGYNLLSIIMSHYFVAYFDYTTFEALYCLTSAESGACTCCMDAQIFMHVSHVPNLVQCFEHSDVISRIIDFYTRLSH